MSLRVIKPGLLDTIQDLGRWGYQSLGVNVGGAMDRLSAQIANALLGKDLNDPVIEMHFPAAVFEVEESTIICFAGVDFSPTINGEAIPIHQSILVGQGAVIKCTHLNKGARCYLAVWQGFELDSWLGSYSTAKNNNVGGYKGRSLKKDDVLSFKKRLSIKHLLKDNQFITLPWKSEQWSPDSNAVHFLTGHEWDVLPVSLQTLFLNSTFTIAVTSDRMGYRLNGKALKLEEPIDLISSAVNFGTIQLLPNGQLIVLMADHQTTGGYPRIGHVITAHLPNLAQAKPNDSVRFTMTTQKEAEEKLLSQQQYLLQLQNACTFKMETLLYAAH